MAYSRFRDRSGLVTRRRVIQYLQRERERKEREYSDDPGLIDSDIYYVDSNGNYFTDEAGNYFIAGNNYNGQASLI